MHRRLLTYTGLLCLTLLLLLVSIQYLLSSSSDGIDVGGREFSVARRSANTPSYLTRGRSYIPVSTAGPSSNIIPDNVASDIYSPAASCRMDNCFDFSQCKHGFTVYVYPVIPDQILSESYLKILNIIKSSAYYTTDPAKACIFISSIDTLDRDHLSVDYVRNLQQQLTNLPHWNNGRNHVIYNLYSGTWPDYSEQFGIDIGYAILAKASVSTDRFRAGFDISLPLFHKTLPERAGEPGQLLNINIPSTSKYLLAFKGKRYLTGVGSVSRNALYHIHNDKDIIMLTTCKHGKGWEKYADVRCDGDNALFDQYDYKDLLANSTFCLVPRGRRLGSFRFLEVLQYGCIPVLLSNNWELPFSDVIDWKRAAIWADESLIYQLPYSLRAMRYTTISSLKQQSQLLWSKYFSSFDKIVLTTLQIIKDRVESHNSQPCGVWNTHPGAYSLSPSYSKDLTMFPFFTQTDSTTEFTVLLYITERSRYLRKVLDSITSATHIHSVFMFVVGRSDILPFVNSVSKSSTEIPTHVHFVINYSDSFKFYQKLPTDAVLTINQRDLVITEELDFAFSVWKEYPSRLVGHLARSHLWHNGEQKYHYTSKLTPQYSIILSDTAIFHKYYLFEMKEFIERWDDAASIEHCSDILLNFITSDVTGLPPIKVGQRLSFSPASQGSFAARVSCVDILYGRLGYLPLQTSHVRLDPALFRDNVALSRKRYPNMERTLE